MQAKRSRGSFRLFWCGAILALLMPVTSSGCRHAGPAVDTAGFESAMVDYLKLNDMQLKVKAIKKGPTVDGNAATLSASMTHLELGGPSVVWTFHFEKRVDGQWTVVRHES